MFAATHAVPVGGLPAYAGHDAADAAVAHLEPQLAVQLLDTWGDWVHVECANSWTCWVDGRLLVPLAVPEIVDADATNARPPRLALIGAACVLVGTLLPWFSFGPVDITAWDVPVFGLISGSPSSTQLTTGFALLPVLLIGLPFVTHRPLPEYATLALGFLATNLALLGAEFARAGTGAPGLGIGLFLALAGGVLILWEPVGARLRKIAVST